MDKERPDFSAQDFEELASQVRKLEYELANLGEIMQRIDNESYGLCITCGSPIEPERLETMPGETFCSRHLEPSEKLI